VSTSGKIRIGIGGWTFEPWRGTFYPDRHPQARELEYASQHLTSIEINGTYYGSQKPESFLKWHDETPEDFVFSLKASRFSTNRKVLAEAKESVDRFVASGIAGLKTKLGPINWQFADSKKLDLDDFGKFLELLPKSVDGIALRHALEVRNDSFRTPEFVALARAHGAAIILAGDSKFPMIPDATAPFIYARIMGTTEGEALGYSARALDLWAARAKVWATGQSPDGLDLIGSKPPAEPRDVFLYVISGHKEKNPAAAMALIERLRG
jgi:uncharacterized protein YecE (DUF72 family)